MSYQQVIARRYAKGLKLSVNKSDLLDVEQQLGDFVAMAQKNHDLGRILADPAFSPLELKAVINRLAKKFELNEALRHFLLLLITKRRMALLPAIHDAYVVLVDQAIGRLRALIKSASPISAESLDDVSEALALFGKKEILINAMVDKSLLAGMRLEVGGKIFDGTLKAKLDAMRSKLLNEIR